MQRLTTMRIGLAAIALLAAGCGDGWTPGVPKGSHVQKAVTVDAGVEFTPVDEDYAVLLATPAMWRDAGFSPLTKVRLAVLARKATMFSHQDLITTVDWAERKTSPAETLAAAQALGQTARQILNGEEAGHFGDLFTRTGLPHAIAKVSNFTPGTLQWGPYVPPEGITVEPERLCPWEDVAAWKKLEAIEPTRQIGEVAGALAVVGYGESEVRAVGGEWLQKARVDESRRQEVIGVLRGSIKTTPLGDWAEHQRNEQLIEALLHWVDRGQVEVLTPLLAPEDRGNVKMLRENVWKRLAQISPEDFRKQAQTQYATAPSEVDWMWRSISNDRDPAIAMVGKGLESQIDQWKQARRGAVPGRTTVPGRENLPGSTIETPAEMTVTSENVLKWLGSNETDKVRRGLVALNSANRMRRGVEPAEKLQFAGAQRTQLVRALGALASGGDVFNRQESLRALGVYVTADEIDVLLPAIDGRESGQAALALALAIKIAPQKGMAAMESHLSLASTAASMLANEDDDAEAKAGLMLRSTRPEVRRAGRVLLDRVGTQTSVAALRAAMAGERDRFEQMMYEQTLKRVAARAPGSVKLGPSAMAADVARRTSMQEATTAPAAPPANAAEAATWLEGTDARERLAAAVWVQKGIIPAALRGRIHEALRATVENGTGKQEVEAIRALGAMGMVEDLQGLLTLTGRYDPTEAAAATAAGLRTAAGRVIPKLEGKNEAFFTALTEELRLLGPKAEEGALVLLACRDRLARQCGVAALADIGGKRAASFLPGYISRETDEALKDAAKESLKKIEDRDKGK